MLIKINITREKTMPVGLKDDKNNTPIDNKINVNFNLWQFFDLLNKLLFTTTYVKKEHPKVT